MPQLTLAVLLPVLAGFSAAQWRAYQRAATLRARLGQTLQSIQEKHAEMAAQNALDQNINHLRLALSALGPPHVSGGMLYFGSTAVNGDEDIVDDVRNRFGGAATIFLRDERIATNVQNAQGERALGTKLAPGPVHEQIFQRKISYRGQATILGEPYTAIYEPILSGDTVIGILFAGSKKSTAAPQPPPDLNLCISQLQAMAQAQAEAAEEAAQRRQAAEDQRRRLEAERQALATQQQEAVKQLAAGLDALAQGDLSATLQDPFTAGYERLRLDFNGALARLQQSMRTVMQNSDSLRRGTDSIMQSLDDLSHRTTQQAEGLQETAQALAEVTNTVNQTAKGAAQAQGIVGQTRAAAGHAIAVLEQTVAAITGIEASSNQIASIIGVMDDIAFQTNLLALNAGVEAARAGDSGRGFAVVASEVRALAQRSATAAKEIKGLITLSGTQVSQGVQCVAETTTALHRIDTQINQLESRINSFAGAAQNQSTGLQQINLAMAEMDKITQQNAAMADESTAASHQLSAQAEDLAGLIGHFKIEPTAPKRPVVRPAKAGIHEFS